MYKSKLILTACALALFPLADAGAEPLYQEMEGSIQIDQNGPTHNLKPVGQFDANTKVYTDTSGLELPVNMQAIQQSNPALGQPTPMMAPQPPMQQQTPAAAMAAPAAAPMQRTTMAPMNPPPAGGHQPQYLMEMSVEEASAVPVMPAMQPDRFSDFDIDGNGWVSEQEFLVNELSIYGLQIFRKLDVDENKQLDRQELARREQIKVKHPSPYTEAELKAMN